MTIGITGISKGRLWTSRIMRGFTIAFLLFDSLTKVFKVPQVVEATVKIGFHESVVVPIGLTLLLCTVLYIIPRTSVFGAILLTAYLGGAVATNVFAQTPLFNLVFPMMFGVIAWAGLWLQNGRLRELVPLASE